MVISGIIHISCRLRYAVRYSKITMLAGGLFFSGSLNGLSHAEPVDLICSGTIVDVVNSKITPHMISDYHISLNLERKEINDKFNNAVYVPPNQL